MNRKLRFIVKESLYALIKIQLLLVIVNRVRIKQKIDDDGQS